MFSNATFTKIQNSISDLTGAGEALSRRKSFKKTLRESFRRLRKGRSTRNNPSAPTPITEARPIERQIEARPADDGMNSLVRCLTFAQTFITNSKFVFFGNSQPKPDADVYFVCVYSSFNDPNTVVGHECQLRLCLRT